MTEKKRSWFKIILNVLLLGIPVIVRGISAYRRRDVDEGLKAAEAALEIGLKIADDVEIGENKNEK